MEYNLPDSRRLNPQPHNPEIPRVKAWAYAGIDLSIGLGLGINPKPLLETITSQSDPSAPLGAATSNR